MPNMLTNFTTPVNMTVTPSLANTYVPSTASASILPTVTPIAPADIYGNSMAKMSKLSKKQLKALVKQQKQLLQVMPTSPAVTHGYTDPYNTDEAQNLPDKLPGGVLYGTKLLEVLAQAPSTSKCIGNTSFWIQCDKKNVLPIIQHMFSLSSKVITLEHQNDFAMQVHPIGNTYEVAFIDYVNKRSIGLVNLTKSEVESITPTFNILNQDKTATTEPATTEPATNQPTTDEDLLGTTDLDETEEETATPEEPAPVNKEDEGFPYGTLFGVLGGALVASGTALATYLLCRRGNKNQETPVESFIIGPVSKQGPRDLMGDLRKEHHAQVATNNGTETEHLAEFDRHVGEVRTKIKGEQLNMDLESGLAANQANTTINNYDFVPVNPEVRESIANAPQSAASAPALPPLPPELMSANSATQPLSIKGQSALNSHRSSIALRKSNRSYNPDDLLSGIVHPPALQVSSTKLPGQLKTPSPQITQSTGILSQLLAGAKEVDPQTLANNATIATSQQVDDLHSNSGSNTGYDDSPATMEQIQVVVVKDPTSSLQV